MEKVQFRRDYIRTIRMQVNVKIDRILFCWYNRLTRHSELPSQSLFTQKKRKKESHESHSRPDKQLSNDSLRSFASFALRKRRKRRGGGGGGESRGTQNFEIERVVREILGIVSMMKNIILKRIFFFFLILQNSRVIFLFEEEERVEKCQNFEITKLKEF